MHILCSSVAAGYLLASCADDGGVVAHRLGAEMAPHVLRMEAEEEAAERRREERRAAAAAAAAATAASTRQASPTPSLASSTTSSSVKSTRLTWTEAALSTAIKDEKVGQAGRIPMFYELAKFFISIHKFPKWTNLIPNDYYDDFLILPKLRLCDHSYMIPPLRSRIRTTKWMRCSRVLHIFMGKKLA